MLTYNEIEHLIDCSYKIRLSALKSITKSGTGYFGACMAMADIFTVLYFNPINQASNGFDTGNKDKVILMADHLKPLWYASLAHAGQIPLKALYADQSLTSNQNRTIRLGENRLSQAVELARSYRSRNNNAKVFIIIGIEELLKNEDLSLLDTDKCSIPRNVTFILDLGILFLYKNEIAKNRILTIKEKLTALGCNLRECDGHNYDEILSTLAMEGADNENPLFIFPHTISGKGIITIEGNLDWNYKVPSSNEVREFCCQLEESFKINKMRLHTHNASRK